MANPSGNGANNDSAHPSHPHVHSGNGNSLPEPVLQHNPGISSEWTPEEQGILENGLSLYASETNIIRYAKIAVQLQNKTVRDVALRCRWMEKRGICKRRKEDYSLARKIKDRKEKLTDLSESSPRLATLNGYSSYVHGAVVNNKSNAILYSALDSPTGQLLQQNAQALEQISANLETHQVLENISLFCQARENILQILTNLCDMPEKMKHMPPLPVKLNDELVGSLVPHSSLQIQ